MFPENEEIRKLLSDWLKNENNAISGNNFKETMNQVNAIYNNWLEKCKNLEKQIL